KNGIRRCGFEATWNQRKIFAENPVNQLLDPGMLYYRNNPKRMQKWIDEWLYDNGKVWSEQIGDRNSIIKRFSEVKDKYDEILSISMRHSKIFEAESLG
ncbi:MAG: hypothetical protein LUG27_01820, partial [Clostridiales bacterium]|nr:hypothetical protein [Clostridiales bacterium]